jgi:glucose-1-phosphate cytidylyltransferase
MVFKKEALDFIEPNTMIENVFSKLVDINELSVYKHNGKWKCMDTYKEVEEMNEHWEKDPFWKVW